MLEKWRNDKGRTLYLLDVRSKEEFEARRLAGSVHAPGGQLVQATDEYVGVRNSRIVLVDPERVRSAMTASWLNQMGWDDVHVLEPEGDDGFGGCATESGPRRRPVLGLTPWKTVLPKKLGEDSAVLDLSTSLRFRARHIPGAWWAVRSRLPEAAALWPHAAIRVLEGGNAAWFAAGLPLEAGIERATTTLDDVAYKAYDHTSDYEKHAREYLDWEVALVEQIKRDPAIRFRSYD
jgi:rhodanese-related sulfurtransferase